MRRTISKEFSIDFNCNKSIWYEFIKTSPTNRKWASFLESLLVLNHLQVAFEPMFKNKILWFSSYFEIKKKSLEMFKASIKFVSFWRMKLPKSHENVKIWKYVNSFLWWKKCNMVLLHWGITTFNRLIGTKPFSIPSWIHYTIPNNREKKMSQRIQRWWRTSVERRRKKNGNLFK